MRKLAIYLLDSLIVLVLCWAIFFRQIFESFWVFVGTIVALLASIFVWAQLTARRQVKAEEQRKAQVQKQATLQEEERRIERLQQEQATHARRKLLEKEHEARRPVCGHCGKKTNGVFQHRRIDGAPDRRYRDNPLLCDQCFQPYQPIRPWNLREHQQGRTQPPHIDNDV